MKLLQKSFIMFFMMELLLQKNKQNSLLLEDSFKQNIEIKQEI